MSENRPVSAAQDLNNAVLSLNKKLKKNTVQTQKKQVKIETDQ